MQIIFNNQDLSKLQDRYTLLELDTMNIPGHGQLTAFAVIENFNLSEIETLDNYKNLHSKLMENYRKKNWSFCEDAISHLMNRWSGELKTFYSELSDRIAKYKEQDPGPEWSGIYEKDFSSTSD